MGRAYPAPHFDASSYFRISTTGPAPERVSPRLSAVLVELTARSVATARSAIGELEPLIFVLATFAYMVFHRLCVC